MKNKIITFIIIGYLLFFSILNIIVSDEVISKTERRKLATFPNFELTNEYITKIDKYLLDHFVYRDYFRSIKANYNYKVLNKLDNNDIYLDDNYIYKSNYPTNEKSIDNFIKITKNTSKLFLNNNIYLMIIPDKNYYLLDNNFLKIDYNHIYKKLNELQFNEIYINDLLTIDDYYETDTHWKQEKLHKVVKKMNEIMQFNYIPYPYNESVYDKFYGVYYGESAINRKPERLIYLTNDIVNNAEVTYLENKNLNRIYNLDKLNSLDSYEVYLDGASSYIEINNKNSSSSKELIVFRDSFASSLVPLLIPYYEKITLIDNRYISSDNYLSLLEINNQDVLFMYSTLFINNSGTLKG